MDGLSNNPSNGPISGFGQNENVESGRGADAKLFPNESDSKTEKVGSESFTKLGAEDFGNSNNRRVGSAADWTETAGSGSNKDAINKTISLSRRSFGLLPTGKSVLKSIKNTWQKIAVGIEALNNKVLEKFFIIDVKYGIGAKKLTAFQKDKIKNIFSGYKSDNKDNRRNLASVRRRTVSQMGEETNSEIGANKSRSSDTIYAPIALPPSQPPPSSQYGKAPSSQYGKMPFSQYGKMPFSQYGKAPSSQYGKMDFPKTPPPPPPAASPPSPPTAASTPSSEAASAAPPPSAASTPSSEAASAAPAAPPPTAASSPSSEAAPPPPAASPPAAPAAPPPTAAPAAPPPPTPTAAPPPPPPSSEAAPAAPPPPPLPSEAAPPLPSEAAPTPPLPSEAASTPPPPAASPPAPPAAPAAPVASAALRKGKKALKPVNKELSKAYLGEKETDLQKQLLARRKGIAGQDDSVEDENEVEDKDDIFAELPVNSEEPTFTGAGVGTSASTDSEIPMKEKPTQTTETTETKKPMPDRKSLLEKIKLSNKGELKHVEQTDRKKVEQQNREENLKMNIDLLKRSQEIKEENEKNISKKKEEEGDPLDFEQDW